MRVVHMNDLGGRQVDSFGSRQFTVFPLLPQAHVAVAHVGVGGLIAEHSAVVDQLLVVVVGRAVVTGGEGHQQEIAAGQAVLWAASEGHQTEALTDLTVVVIEGDGLVDVLSPTP